MKRVQIQEPIESRYAIIGIATSIRIWTLCYQLNQALDLSLKAYDEEGLPVDNEEIESGSFLFSESEISPIVSVYYQDVDSFLGQEFTLRFPPRVRLSKEIRNFAYFLLIRFESMNTPDLAEILSKINTLEQVISAVDISHIKNIKSLFL